MLRRSPLAPRLLLAALALALAGCTAAATGGGGPPRGAFPNGGSGLGCNCGV